jgi:polyphosphate kinase
VQDPAIKARLVDKVLGIQVADNTKAWLLEPDGSYSLVPRAEGNPARNSQAELMALSVGESTPTRRKKAPARPKMKPRPKPR